MRRAALMLAWILGSVSAIGQYTIKGVVSDAENQPLPGTNILLTELGRGVATQKNGSFVMNRVPEGDFLLVITFVGYESYSAPISVDKDLDLGTISLERATILGEEVIVSATRAHKNPGGFFGYGQ